MADSNLFKPNTSSAGLGKKSMDKGQFANPPAYPETAWQKDSGAIKSQSPSVGTVQKTPSAKKGRI